MAYLAVDSDGSEWIFESKPEKDNVWSTWDNFVELPYGSIEKLIGKKLTWEHEPVEI